MKRYSLLIWSFLGVLTFSLAQLNNTPNTNDTTTVKTNAIKNVENKAFTYGEKLEFKIYYGLLNGGVATFEVGNKPIDINGRNSYHIKVKGNSEGLVDVMFKVRDEFESFVDEDAIIPWKATKNIKEGKYRDTDFILFDHKNGIANSGRKGKIEIEQQTQDVVSALYFARTTNMTNAKVGDVFPMNFYLDGKNYQLRFKFIGRENLKTNAGTFKTLLVKPQLLEGRVFKDSEALTLWVTDDDNHLPIRVESELFVGSIKADLVKFSGIKNPLTAKIK